MLCGCGGLVMSIFYNICVRSNGVEINQIYLYNECSGGGLEITKYAKI